MLRFFAVFLLLTAKVFAQDPDALVASILRLENDTEKVNQLYKYGFEQADKNPKLAFMIARYCEEAAVKSKSPIHLSKGYNLPGILYSKYGQYKKALSYFEKYAAINQSLNNKLLLAYGFTNFGNIYLRLKEFHKAEKAFLSAIELYNELGNKAEVANGLINLGALKQTMKQPKAALANYEKALQSGKALNDYEIKAICLNNMAQIFFEEGDYEKALAHNYDALELRDLMGLEVDKCDSYLSIAEVALAQKNISLAEENLNAASVLCTKLDYLEGKIALHKLLSELNAQQNNFQLAFENLKTHDRLNDSFLQLQSDEPVYEYTDMIEENHNYTQPPIKNLWLLFILTVFLISIPFILIRYKR